MVGANHRTLTTSPKRFDSLASTMSIKTLRKAVTDRVATFRCRDCYYAIPVTDFHTLSVKGEPTLARCKFFTVRSRLLSEKACETHFRDRDDV
jgi:hypothetical protein